MENIDKGQVTNYTEKLRILCSQEHILANVNDAPRRKAKRMDGKGVSSMIEVTFTLFLWSLFPFQNSIENRKVFECSVCFLEYSERVAIHCTPSDENDPGWKNVTRVSTFLYLSVDIQEVHAFCVNCIRGHAESAVTQPVINIWREWNTMVFTGSCSWWCWITVYGTRMHQRYHTRFVCWHSLLLKQRTPIHTFTYIYRHGLLWFGRVQICVIYGLSPLLDWGSQNDGGTKWNIFIGTKIFGTITFWNLIFWNFVLDFEVFGTMTYECADGSVGFL